MDGDAARAGVAEGEVRAGVVVHEDGVGGGGDVVLAIAASVGGLFHDGDVRHVLHRQPHGAGRLRHAAAHHLHAAAVDGALIAALRRARADEGVEGEGVAASEHRAVDGLRRQRYVAEKRLRALRADVRLAQHRAGGDAAEVQRADQFAPGDVHGDGHVAVEVGKGKVRACRFVHEDGVVAAFHIILIVAAAVGLFCIVGNAVHLLKGQIERAGRLRHAAAHHLRAAAVEGGLVAALRRARAHGVVEGKTAAVGHEGAVDGLRRQTDVGDARGGIAQRRGGGDIDALRPRRHGQDRQEQRKREENGETALHIHASLRGFFLGRARRQAASSTLSPLWCFSSVESRYSPSSPSKSYSQSVPSSRRRPLPKLWMSSRAATPSAS